MLKITIITDAEFDENKPLLQEIIRILQQNEFKEIKLNYNRVSGYATHSQFFYW